MKWVEIVSFLLCLIMLFSCSEKRTDIYAPVSEPEWVTGVWLDCEQNMQKIEFRENDEFRLIGYGEYENLSVGGIYDLWSDGEHFKLDLNETTDPYNFPVGDYSGSFLYDNENPDELTVMLNQGQAFPGTIQNADFCCHTVSIPEMQFGVISNDLEITSISGYGTEGIETEIICWVFWECSEAVSGFNLYRCMANSTQWQKVKPDVLSPAENHILDIYIDELYFGYSGAFPVTYMLEGILPDGKLSIFSLPELEVIELDPIDNFTDKIGDSFPQVSADRINYYETKLEWNILPEISTYGYYDFEGYRVYRCFDDELVNADWELVFECDKSCTVNSYTDSVDWSDKSMVYYSVVRLESTTWNYPDGPQTVYRETPRYADVERVLR